MRKLLCMHCSKGRAQCIHPLQQQDHVSCQEPQRCRFVELTFACTHIQPTATHGHVRMLCHLVAS
jgi:hypothetical protein